MIIQKWSKSKFILSVYLTALLFPSVIQYSYIRSILWHLRHRHTYRLLIKSLNILWIYLYHFPWFCILFVIFYIVTLSAFVVFEIEIVWCFPFAAPIRHITTAVHIPRQFPFPLPPPPSPPPPLRTALLLPAPYFVFVFHYLASTYSVYRLN